MPSIRILNIKRGLLYIEICVNVIFFEKRSAGSSIYLADKIANGIVIIEVIKKQINQDDMFVVAKII